MDSNSGPEPPVPSAPPASNDAQTDANASACAEAGKRVVELDACAGTDDLSCQANDLRERVSEAEQFNAFLARAAAKLHAELSQQPPQVDEQTEARLSAADNWETFEQSILTGVKVYQMPANDLEECRRECARRGCGGFQVLGGTAFLNRANAEDTRKAITTPFPAAVSYIRRE
eukprot:TRINITY_DN7914_c0_g2_i2.p1 TRINITY_DN7914_c0_g2~~TRINITY_DN7914_c0_g2_i2.p1  ORF type:complete len:203 (+),score=72.33 TRINITY_DN7914_c0_g2_i2:89-610(+)